MSKTKTDAHVKRDATPSDHATLVGEALRDAMLALDAPRCGEVAKIAAQLVAVEIEGARRLGASKPAKPPHGSRRRS